MNYKITISAGKTLDIMVSAEDELVAEQKALLIAKELLSIHNIDDYEFLVDSIEELDEEDKPSGQNRVN